MPSGTNVTTDHEAREIFQAGYFDAIDRGDFVAAAGVMTADVDWSHRAAWQQDDLGFDLQALDQFHDRDGVYRFLEVSAPRVVSAGLRHVIADFVFQQGRGAFTCKVTSAQKPDVAWFMVWFELDGNQVARYVMRPI